MHTYYSIQCSLLVKSLLSPGFNVNSVTYFGHIGPSSSIYGDLHKCLYCTVVIYNPHGLRDTTVQYNSLRKQSCIPDDDLVWLKHTVMYLGVCDYKWDIDW
jgi:hypothetical protein